VKRGVKICGLTEVQGLRAACDERAEWIGFVFFARSPRFVTPVQAARLVSSISTPLPETVGLFVKATDEEIAATLTEIPLSVLQIYDTPERARSIRERFSLPVWLSRAVSGTGDLPTEADIDGYVIEPRPPAGATRPGGNGVTLDWRLMRSWQAPAPWMLAGGLTPESVADAIVASGAQAVDVSSGVETAPGQKSPELIRNFIKNARSASVGTCAPERN